MQWKHYLENYEPLIKIIIIIVSAVILNKFIRTMITAYLRRESARINIDPTAYNFLKNALTFLIVIFASLSITYSIPAFKQLAVTLFAGAGILAAIIGFASQAAFSNIINGVFIVIFKPFRIGDMIEIGQNQDAFIGVVEEITLRHTVIKSLENKRVVIPNSVISEEIIVNRSLIDKKVIRFYEISISYDSDLNKAMQIIAEEAEKHPLFVDFRTPEQIEKGTPKVPVVLLKFADFGMVLRGYICGADWFSSFQLHTDLNKIIKERFDKEGIEIPYPYFNIIQKSPKPSAKKQ